MKLTTILAVACWHSSATDARADIVVFKNGRTMSVKACLLDGDMATLRLREGGEVTFPAAIVARVEPDEVPYPESGTGSREPGDGIGRRRQLEQLRRP